MSRHHDDDVRIHERKHAPGKGPKEKEIAAALTAATVALAGSAAAYPDLATAGDAVAGIYTKMFDLVTSATPRT